MNQLRLQLNWEKENGLIPAIVQDAGTGVVLMLGYMNEEALERTLETKKVWFYSRSKGRLWMKGETSGNTLEFVHMKADCDSDALLVKALPQGPTCHTGATSCFNESKVNDILSE
ncbi:MAG: phosphoribosyl-AMP cyclohydrolase, partial [Bacteroidota bacterium]